MWFKDFKLDWFGTRKVNKQLEELTSIVKDLVNKEQKSDKPYKNAYYANGILTVVFHNAEVISKICSANEAKALNDCKTEMDIRKLFDVNYVKMVATNDTIPEEEVNAQKLLVKHSDEVLDILGDNFKKLGSDFFYKKVDLPIPTILLNAMVENKRLGKKKVFKSLVNFWLWTSLNPIESSRQDLFAFIRKNDVKLTPGGLLVLYRRIVSVNNNKHNPNDKKLEEVISLEYFKTKKVDKKSPKDYSLILLDGEIKRVKVGREGDNEVIGNLADLYTNMSAISTNVYTDAHTRTMKIQIGSIYKIDEDKVDINSRNDCSAGLHVASKRYNYSGFGDTPVLCLVNPSKVRSVPIGECSKMRVSEMFIASKLEHNGYEYMDDDLDLVPFEDEYSKITLEELERESENHFKSVKPTVTVMPLGEKDSIKVIEDIKKHMQKRIKLIN